MLKSRPRPCGYWLAPSETDAVQRLRLLGIEVQQLDELGEVRGETYRETGRETIGGGGERATPARRRACACRRSRRCSTSPAGGYYVSLEQPLANLAVAALEPESTGRASPPTA